VLFPPAGLPQEKTRGRGNKLKIRWTNNMVLLEQVEEVRRIKTIRAYGHNSYKATRINGAKYRHTDKFATPKYKDVAKG
jgi:hypothetical protein